MNDEKEEKQKRDKGKRVNWFKRQTKNKFIKI